MVLYKGYCRPLGKKVDFTVKDVISMNTKRGIKWRVKGTYDNYNISTFCSKLVAEDLLNKLPLTMDAEIAYTPAAPTYESEELLPLFSNATKNADEIEAEEEMIEVQEQIQENTNAQELDLHSEKLPAKYYKKNGSLDMRYSICREYAAKRAESQNAVELEAPYIPANPTSSVDVLRATMKKRKQNLAELYQELEQRNMDLKDKHDSDIATYGKVLGSKVLMNKIEATERKILKKIDSIENLQAKIDAKFNLSYRDNKVLKDIRSNDPTTNTASESNYRFDHRYRGSARQRRIARRKAEESFDALGDMEFECSSCKVRLDPHMNENEIKNYFIKGCSECGANSWRLVPPQMEEQLRKGELVTYFWDKDSKEWVEADMPESKEESKFDAESFEAAYTPEQKLDDYTPEQLTTSSAVTGDFFEDSLKYSYGGIQAAEEIPQEETEIVYAEGFPALQNAEAGMVVENIENYYKDKEDKFMTLVVDEATLFRLASDLPIFVELTPSKYAGYTNLKFNYVKNPDLEQKILSYAISLPSDMEQQEEPEYLAGDVRNRLFDVEFDDWAEQEMKTHGKDVSFKEWADEESKSHGDEEFMDWAKHEEESHDERYEAEGGRNVSDFEMGNTDRYEIGDEIIALSSALKRAGDWDWKNVKKIGKGIKQGKYERIQKHMADIDYKTRRVLWDKHHNDFYNLFNDEQMRGLAIPWVTDKYKAESFDAQTWKIKCDVCGEKPIYDTVDSEDYGKEIQVCEECFNNIFTAESFDAERREPVFGDEEDGVVMYADGSLLVKVVGFPTPFSNDPRLIGESMWVVVKKGNEYEGKGYLANKPIHSSLKFGTLIDYGYGTNIRKPMFKGSDKTDIITLKQMLDPNFTGILRTTPDEYYENEMQLFGDEDEEILKEFNEMGLLYSIDDKLWDKKMKGFDAESFEADDEPIFGDWEDGVVMFEDGSLLVRVVGFPGEESMWVVVKKGNEYEGKGYLSNDPNYSSLKFGTLIEYGEGTNTQKPVFKGSDKTDIITEKQMLDPNFTGILRTTPDEYYENEMQLFGDEDEEILKEFNEMGLLYSIDDKLWDKKMKGFDAESFEAEKINTFSEIENEWKDSPVTIYDEADDEFYGVKEILVQEEDDVLEDGQPYLVLNKDSGDLDSPVVYRDFQTGYDAESFEATQERKPRKMCVNCDRQSLAPSASRLGQNICRTCQRRFGLKSKKAESFDAQDEPRKKCINCNKQKLTPSATSKGYTICGTCTRRYNLGGRKYAEESGEDEYKFVGRIPKSMGIGEKTEILRNNLEYVFVKANRPLYPREVVELYNGERGSGKQSKFKKGGLSTGKISRLIKSEPQKYYVSRSGLIHHVGESSMKDYIRNLPAKYYAEENNRLVDSEENILKYLQNSHEYIRRYTAPWKYTSYGIAKEFGVAPSSMRSILRQMELNDLVKTVSKSVEDSPVPTNRKIKIYYLANEKLMN